MGSLIETPALYPNLSIRDNIKIAVKLKKIKDEASVLSNIRKVGIEDYSIKVKNCSAGTKQKIGIIIALIGHPSLIILDEPFSGLDPVSVIQLRNYLKRIAIKENATILISSHMLNELYSFASEFIFINKGKVKGNFSKAEIEAKKGEGSIEKLYLKWLRGE